MRCLRVGLLVGGVALGACAPAPGVETAPPPIPTVGSLNSHVLEVLATYPRDGTHAYHWPREGSWRGNARTLSYQGKVLLPGDPQGRCHCSGLTFEVFFQAWERWAAESGLEPGMLDYDRDQVLGLQADWFGSAAAIDTLHGALTRRGLGVRIHRWSDARPGDFVQLWRHSGSGHSAVFLRWERQDGAIAGLTYWSTQQRTHGIGEATEYFAPPGQGGGTSLLRRDRLWICRVGNSRPR